MSDQNKDAKLDHTGRVIRDEIRTTATPQQAYEAWADPEKISQWFTDRAEGRAEPGATITWIFDAFNYRIPYEVLLAQPDEKFAIRWNPPPGMNINAGILEVTISKEGGDTVVRLIQSGFREGAQWDDEFEGVASGWGMALARLKLYLENYYAVPRRSILVMRPADFTFDRLLPFHRTGEGLRKWLTTSGDFSTVGAPFRLQLQEGGMVTGQVLAKTRRETALSWDEIRGVLELKPFSMGPQKMLCVQVCGWGLDATEAKQIDTQMQSALARLATALKSSTASA